VQITLFTPAEETLTGADWYWRFENGVRAIHARVQAKRVQRTSFGQEDSDGHFEIDHNQLRRLINATESSLSQIPGLQAWFATFARYDAMPPCGLNDLSHCSRHRHERACANQPSLWIAQACKVQNILEPRLTVRRVIERSVRLDCILPCSDEPGERQGPAEKGFRLADDLPKYQDCLDIIQGNPTLLKSFRGALRIFV
jgi:hypothetical protein